MRQKVTWAACMIHMNNEQQDAFGLRNATHSRVMKCTRDCVVNSTHIGIAKYQIHGERKCEIHFGSRISHGM